MRRAVVFAAVLAVLGLAGWQVYHRMVPVTPGIKDEGLVEILHPQVSGLVVTLGQHLLEEGSPVIISEGEKGTPAQGVEQSASERATSEQAGSERAGK